MIPIQYVEFVIYGAMRMIKVMVSDYFELFEVHVKKFYVQVQNFY